MNGSGSITRRGFIGGALLAGSAARRSRRALPGLAKAQMDLRRSFPAGPLHFPPTTARIRNFASSGGM